MVSEKLKIKHSLSLQKRPSVKLHMKLRPQNWLKQRQEYVPNERLNVLLWKKEWH